MLKSIIAKLPDIFLSILISFSITYALTSAMGFDYPPVSTLLIILAVTAVLLVAFHSRISSVVTAVLAGVAVVFCCLCAGRRKVGRSA